VAVVARPPVAFAPLSVLFVPFSVSGVPWPGSDRPKWSWSHLPRRLAVATSASLALPALPRLVSPGRPLTFRFPRTRPPPPTLSSSSSSLFPAPSPSEVLLPAIFLWPDHGPGPWLQPSALVFWPGPMADRLPLPPAPLVFGPAARRCLPPALLAPPSPSAGCSAAPCPEVEGKTVPASTPTLWPGSFD
jgi:hypothetical protein